MRRATRNGDYVIINVICRKITQSRPSPPPHWLSTLYSDDVDLELFLDIHEKQGSQYPSSPGIRYGHRRRITVSTYQEVYILYIEGSGTLHVGHKGPIIQPKYRVRPLITLQHVEWDIEYRQMEASARCACRVRRSRSRRNTAR